MDVPDPDMHERERITARLLSHYRKNLPDDRRRLIEQYRGIDIARKVVGVGSVGLQAWIVVMEGAAEKDHLVLQIKEARDSVLAPFVGKNAGDTPGQRVVEGQKAMQIASDVLLGWTFPARTARRAAITCASSGTAKARPTSTKSTEDALEALAGACGWTLAHAHARTGDRFAIAGYLGKGDGFDRALVRFAQSYADQNERDYQAFLESLC